MNISCQLLPWHDDFLGGVAAIAASGIRGCEFGSHWIDRYDRQLDDLRRILMEHNVVVSAVYATGNFHAQQYRRETCLHHERLGKRLSKLGVSTVVLSPGIRWRGMTDGDDRARILEMIREIHLRYRHQGIQTSIHPHRGTVIFTREEIDYFMERLPDDIGLTPDTGHLLAASVNISSLLKTYVDRMTGIHLKDAVKVSAGRVQFCEWGQGEVDLAWIISFLRNRCFPGWLTVEIEHEVQDPRKSIEQCKQLLLGENFFM